ncbi:hypothetical protein HanRHA438_Chr13g0619061 [Helianthus annuus]|nr:hypothetical protein HanIR_Chr13g0660981 [Helianthus annuus]KAJ0860012.1 hypothetical protein HanRHA438_Chr13g0619061 [Helianthus annuus]
MGGVWWWLDGGLCRERVFVVIGFQRFSLYDLAVSEVLTLKTTKYLGFYNFYKLLDLY